MPHTRTLLIDLRMFMLLGRVSLRRIGKNQGREKRKLSRGTGLLNDPEELLRKGRKGQELLQSEGCRVFAWRGRGQGRLTTLSSILSLRYCNGQTTSSFYPFIQKLSRALEQSEGLPDPSTEQAMAS